MGGRQWRWERPLLAEYGPPSLMLCSSTSTRAVEGVRMHRLCAVGAVPAESRGPLGTHVHCGLSVGGRGGQGGACLATKTCIILDAHTPHAASLSSFSVIPHACTVGPPRWAKVCGRGRLSPPLGVAAPARGRWFHGLSRRCPHSSCPPLCFWPEPQPPGRGALAGERGCHRGRLSCSRRVHMYHCQHK